MTFVNKNMFQNFVYIVNLHYFRSNFCFHCHGLRYENIKSNLLQFNSTSSTFDLFQVKLYLSTMALGPSTQNFHSNKIEIKSVHFNSVQFNSNQYNLNQFNYMFLNFILSYLICFKTLSTFELFQM